MKWFIQDWAGNVMWNGKTFDSFEEGWEFIYTNAPIPDGLSEHDQEQWFGEFYVEQVKEVN